MDATILLCDYAAVADGKLFISGGGWNLVQPQAGPTAIAMLVRVAWGETNRRTQLRIRLVDEDGNPATNPDDQGESVPIELMVDFEVGRPPGTPQGAAVSVPMAIPIGPMRLDPDRGYEWRFEVAGTRIGSAAFRTWPARGGRAAGPM